MVQNIPVSLASMCFKNKLVNTLKTLVAIKQSFPVGYFAGSHENISTICKLADFDKRTVMKHINKLVSLNFLGYDKNKNLYYLRSWKYFKDNGYDGATFKISEEDMVNFRAMIASAIVALEVSKHMAFCKFNRRRQQKHKVIISDILMGQRRVLSTAWGTVQLDCNSENSQRIIQPDYFGLSNETIGSLLGVGKTYGRRMKHMSENAGYLKTNGRFKMVYSAKAEFMDTRAHLSRGDEDAAGRLRYIRHRGSIMLVSQQHDEIIPQIGLNFKNSHRLQKSAS